MDRIHSLALVAALAFPGRLTTIGPDSPTGTPVPASAGVPMFCADPAHTGLHPGPGPTGDPVDLWRVDLGDRVLASPAVVDGIVYLIGETEERDGGLSCVIHADRPADNPSIAPVSIRCPCPTDGTAPTPSACRGVAANAPRTASIPS